jgi:Glycosyl transferase family 11
MDNAKNYISVNLCGGLGNQLFQIACVYSLAYEYNLTPIIKKIDSSPSVFKHRSVYFNNILRKINVVNEEEYNKINFEKIEEGSANYKKINLESNKSYLLNGYFQSPKYFKKYMPEITIMFNLYENEMTSIRNYYNNIKQNYKQTVSLHVRHGDYLKLQHFHSVLTVDYYTKAINHFDQDDTLFVVFSDDINWCKNNFCIQNVHFVENIIPTNIPLDIFEFCLMSLCDHHIIANSSFSCWAAYLNQNSAKKIIAPFRWFVPDKENNAIKDIYDDGWIII